jgi:ABC-type phosphate transport system substrate-binding protein
VKGFVAVAIGALLLAGFCTATDAAEITGAGSTFVNPIMMKWSAAYSAAKAT